MSPFCTLVHFKHLILKVMKLRKLFWIGLLLLPLLACNDPDRTIETNTKLQFIIPLHSNAASSSATERYTFSGYATFCLANKENAQSCPDNILQVLPGSGSVLLIPNIDGDVNSLQLVWSYSEQNSDEFMAQGAVDLLPMMTKSEQNLQIDIDEVFVPIISKIDDDPHIYIKVMVLGDASFEINSIAEMEIPIIVEHEVLEVRFTL